MNQTCQGCFQKAAGQAGLPVGREDDMHKGVWVGWQHILGSGIHEGKRVKKAARSESLGNQTKEHEPDFISNMDVLQTFWRGKICLKRTG